VIRVPPRRVALARLPWRPPAYRSITVVQFDFDTALLPSRQVYPSECATRDRYDGSVMTREDYVRAKRLLAKVTEILRNGRRALLIPSMIGLPSGGPFIASLAASLRSWASAFKPSGSTLPLTRVAPSAATTTRIWARSAAPDVPEKSTTVD
jgi:hypothetical protein